MNIEEISNDLKEKQKNKRYIHSLGVAYTSASLAMRYGYDIEKAYLAGLIHDCAKLKDSTNEEYMAFCKKNGIKVTKAEIQAPHLLHAKIGAYIAENQYEIKDKEVLDAILSHVTGEPDMTLLQKIVYVADYIEPSRKFNLERLNQIRKVAFENIDLCIYMISNDIIKYLSNNKCFIDSKSKETYEYYKGLFLNGN